MEPLKRRVPDIHSLAAKSYCDDTAACLEAACSDSRATLCKIWYCVAVDQDWNGEGGGRKQQPRALRR